MERITKKKIIQVDGDFAPTIKIGSTLKPGEEIGTAKIPTILEAHPLDKSRVLVDDGMFVSTQTPLFQYRKGLHTEVVGSTHEGIVRIKNGVLSIVSEAKEEVVTAKTWGRVMMVNDSSYVVDVKYLKMPIFVSKGWEVEAPLYCFTNKGVVIAPHHVTDEVRDKIVLLPGAVIKETCDELFTRGALGILAPSIDWNDYVPIFSKESRNVGILHGFGMFPLWRWYYHLLSKMSDVVVEVDFAKSYLYLPISDILMGSLEQDLMLFKEYWWGKQVKELQHESGDVIATLETGEQTPVMAEELFNIR